MEPTEQIEIIETVETTEMPKQKLSIPAAILIAGVMISAAILVSGYLHGAPRVEDTTKKAVAVNIKDIALDNAPFIGDPKAEPMAYFSDYQCPFCKKFDAEILPTLKKDYVDTGKMKIVFKDFTFLGSDSTTAALFAHAVWNLYPDKYFTWREAMFNAQDEEGSQGFGNRASIEALITTIPGLDKEKISADVDAHKDAYQKIVDAETAEAKKFGVEGTPSLIVGKTLLQGYLPLPEYSASVAKALK